MKKITLGKYSTDKYYPRVVKAVTGILARSDVVAPIDVFKEMGLLDGKDAENWRRGSVPYLEKVIKCNLSAASRVLRIFRMHVHDLNLRPSITVYCRWGKGPKTRLRFSKTNTSAIEEAYSRHFIRVRSKRADRATSVPDEAESLPPPAPGTDRTAGDWSHGAGAHWRSARTSGAPRH